MSRPIAGRIEPEVPSRVDEILAAHPFPRRCPVRLFDSLRGSDTPAVIDALTGEVHTYARLASRADAVSAALLEQGASGIVYGRNIIQHRNPGAITQALMGLVHEGLSIDAALALIPG